MTDNAIKLDERGREAAIEQTEDRVWKSYAEHVDAILRAYLLHAAPQGEQGWRPTQRYKKARIGETVLVCVEIDADQYVGEAYFNEEDERWWWVNTGPHDFDASDAIVPVPKFYQPLPAPPAKEGE